MKLPKNIFLFVVLILIFSLTIILGRAIFDNKINAGNTSNLMKEIKKDKSKKLSDNNTQQNIKDDKGVAKIIFAGDLMLDRYNRTIIEKRGVEHFTKNIKDIFDKSDLNVLNLEGPVTGNQTVSLATQEGNSAHFKFTFDKESTKNFLATNRINLVNLGNNHILNFGESGAQETVDFLKENGVEYFGAPRDDKNSYIEKSINGLKIALVSYNRFYNLGSENTVNKIKEAKGKNDIVIVYAHWGNEYKLIQTETQTNIAHSFIDNGADLIIGSHPHVVQPLEIYKNKVIFYSLGNFVFDQFFSEDVRTELLVSVSFSEDGFDFVLTPIYRNQDGSLALSDEEMRKKLLERLAQDSNVSNLIKEKIREGEFEIK
ncbi:MAG: CapA family protein [Candidatus Moranbacteria bacterium]|jgi:poly-gamma-glutamate synthesis protein (capsule biosynthesis protein)|nr:CapA family protein [Candidatus Moranbacteria bacterium]